MKVKTIKTLDSGWTYLESGISCTVKIPIGTIVTVKGNINNTGLHLVEFDNGHYAYVYRNEVEKIVSK